MLEQLQEEDTQALINENGDLVIVHNAGFFSCCTIRLQKIIQFYNKFKKLPRVDSSLQWSKYKENESDVTEVFFKHQDHLQIHINTDHIEFSTDNREDQFSDYNNIQYSQIKPILEKYFTISSQIEEISNKLIKKYSIDTENCTVACLRGSDKRLETKIPDFNKFLDEINTYEQIIIQSDDTSFLEIAMKRMPRAIYFDETYKVKTSQEAVQNYIEKNDRIFYATHFLAIMNIMSKCKKVITNNGNVGMWICLLRGNAKNVKQFIGEECINSKLW